MSAFKVTDLLLGEKNFIDFVDKNLGQEKDRLKNDEFETDFGEFLSGYLIMIMNDTKVLSCFNPQFVSIWLEEY